MEYEWWFNPDGDECHCNGDEYYVYTVEEVEEVCSGSSGSLTKWYFGEPPPPPPPPTSGGSGGTSKPIDDGYDPNYPFKNIFNIPNFPEQAEYFNGVELIDDVIPEYWAGTPRNLAQTVARGNIEDMTFGTNGDVSGILSSLVGVSNNILFDHMQNLFNACTVLDGEMRTVGNAMINRVKNNVGGEFTNTTLDSKVGYSLKFINFLSRFGSELRSDLINNGGNIESVQPRILNYRPIFNGWYNLSHGLQITINDTEHTSIHLDAFSEDETSWLVDVTVTIKDHFGLDKHDALEYQDYHPGFAAWWLLQHTRNFKPFETKIIVKKRIRLSKW